ncbi:MAG TPA: 30S ribosomal protein S15 [Candidatus Marinimicrobia bacterium]|jgi:small subunit ribosomal protein S15|nr:30S ribosomal protein S15 [Candidatus Neomarinimicrobiota bacterium]MDP5957144.1 30S ribosomal protein S15 [Candidatus Neomarinimicrobiota bacterium]MDP6229904.1 30S ribosomal protein S15 [Candidatus Neomarinimicrobiota bacterium]MDP6499314.1 30S ribosomal protein S15 [Candidatus Neomarinimicrobiota bacterium]MDP6726310.1 30S ribosomal protein S15 [Candidatus Neomarinimicrobiota bacterium]|tara:strand:+ start:273 stop:542 length:270 start_codon:yes stop_codon:yes gene_type:complete
MSITKEEKKEILDEFGKHETDTGSAEGQIALLTKRVRELTEHAKQHKKDHHSRRGLVMIVSKRKKLMKYLRRKDPKGYVELVKKLKIRG